MKSDIIDKFCATQEISVVEAMKKIDNNARGILFIIDEEQKVIGSLTDGDIRRWLIKTGELKKNVLGIMNKDLKFKYLGEEDSALTYMKKYRIKALPIVDTDKHLVKIIFESDESKENLFKKNTVLQGVPVIIMAGGKGTRLYPYTKILPKPLIPIGDIPIVERIIDKFVEFGINSYYMTVNYKKGMIKSYFSELNPQYSVTYIEENKPLGTAGSLRLIDRKFDKPIIVTNCDILINANYKSIYEYHQKSGNVMTIVAALKNIIVPYGVLQTKEQGIVVSMEEKPRLSYFINTGMYILDPQIIELIPKDEFFHMTDLTNVLLKKKFKVGIYPISEESFLDMGEFEEMKKMEDRLNFS